MDKGDLIIKSEFDKTVKHPSKRKAPRIDNIKGELLKNIGKITIIGL